MLYRILNKGLIAFFIFILGQSHSKGFAYML